MVTNNIYSQFNPDVVKDLQDIDKKITEEQKSFNPDKEKITRLRFQQLMRGLELNAGLYK